MVSVISAYTRRSKFMGKYRRLLQTHKLDTALWSAYVTTDFISGWDQPDDQPEHQYHNIYSHSF